MNENSSVVWFRQPDEIDDPLTNILRNGARQLLAQAVEMEAEAFLAAMKDLKLPDGRDRVVRHGHGPERTIQTGIGPVEVSSVKRWMVEHGPGETVTNAFSACDLRFRIRSGETERLTYERRVHSENSIRLGVAS